MSTGGQSTKCRRNIAENFNRLSRAHERYRQTTDGRAIAYSERERESLKASKPSVGIECRNTIQLLTSLQLVLLTYDQRRTQSFVLGV